VIVEFDNFDNNIAEISFHLWVSVLFWEGIVTWAIKAMKMWLMAASGGWRGKQAIGDESVEWQDSSRDRQIGGLLTR
jgi:hypothetical protein